MLSSQKTIQKKASELTMGPIVAAVLAVVVLIVLLIIFGGKAKMANDFYGSCEKAGGSVIPPGEDCDEATSGEKPYSMPAFNEKDKKCCVKSLV